MLDIVTVKLGCGYFYLSWTINSNEEICKVQTYVVYLFSPRIKHYIYTGQTFDNFTLPGDTVFNVTVFGTNKKGGDITVKDAITTVEHTSVKTVAIRGM